MTQIGLALAFEAVVISSDRFSGTIGHCDDLISRDEAIEHTRVVVAAIYLPISAATENELGDTLGDGALGR
jgi:2-methylisocitrate lyase-like PEP mutase family enzyme